jgi:putative membrane protein
VRPVWAGLAVLIGLQIAYPLTPGSWLVIATVLCGFLLSVGHAWLSRGPATALRLVAVTALGGLLVEALGVATGFPFGRYRYTGTLGPQLLGVPLVVPLAWTWMAWPAWLAAGRLVAGWLRVPVAGVALAAWDLFLDPQMVAAGYWRWDGGPIPVTNYLGWFGVAIVMMSLLPRVPPSTSDAPMLAVYLWTYYSSVLAHAVFLSLPRSALWGGLGMGTVAVPLTVSLLVRRKR